MVPVHKRGAIHEKDIIPLGHQTFPLRRCGHNKTMQEKADTKKEVNPKKKKKKKTV